MYGQIKDDEVGFSKIANYTVIKLTNKTFRDKLVIYFHKRWEKKDIVWPSRTGEMTA